MATRCECGQVSPRTLERIGQLYGQLCCKCENIQHGAPQTTGLPRIAGENSIAGHPNAGAEIKKMSRKHFPKKLVVFSKEILCHEKKHFPKKNDVWEVWRTVR